MSIATHPVAPEEIMALVDRELSADEAQAVSKHVEHCAECSGLAAELRSTSQSLTTWKVPAIPKELENRITGLAEKRASNGETRKPRLFVRTSFWSWKQWAFAGSGAIGMLVMLIGLATPNLSRPKTAMYFEHRVQGGGGGGGDRDRVQSVDGKLEVTDGEPERIDVGPYSPPAKPKAEPTARGAAIGKDSIGYGAGGMLGGIQHPQSEAKISNSSPAPMIARTVSLSIVVTDFAAGRTLLDNILGERHGYAAQLTVNTAQNATRRLNASLRIPAAELPAAVADLKALGRVENESQSGEEVTQQHADLVARLKNSRDTEQRLRTILEQRTGKISDVLEVEQEIARVRGEIESMEADQKGLEHRVDFATIDLQLTEDYKAELNPPAPSISTLMHNALVAGYRHVSDVVLGILFFFLEYSPMLLLWLAVTAVPVVLFWRRYRRTLATV